MRLRHKLIVVYGDKNYGARLNKTQSTKAAAEQAHVADRPCRGVFNASDFEESFPDLSMSLSQGRRLMRRPLGGNRGSISPGGNWVCSIV